MQSSRNSDRSPMMKHGSNSKSKSKKKLFQKLRKGSTRDSLERTTFTGKSHNDIHVHFKNKHHLRDCSLEDLNKSFSPSSAKRRKALRKQKSRDSKRTPIRIHKIPQADLQQPSYCEYVIDYVQDKDQDEVPSHTKSLSNRSNSNNTSSQRKYQPNQIQRNQPESFSNTGIYSHSTNQQELFYEKEFKETQKELLTAKSKLYEQRYKIECLKKRLIETDKAKNEFQSKFIIEQEKSDEFFIKNEKYKQQLKDQKGEIEFQQEQIQKLQMQKQEDLKFYENALKQFEEKEKQVAQEHNTLIRDLLTNMNQIQKYQSQTSHSQIFHKPMNRIYDVLRKINELMLNQSIHTQSYRSQRSTQEDQKQRDGIKVTKDQILFNGESLSLNNELPIQNKSISNSNRELSSHKNKDTKSHQSSLNSNFISDSNRDNQMQFEFLQKIQKEMQKVKEESQKVIEENSKLAQQNQELNSVLLQEKQKAEQGLIPQYREAFDQMRVANEMMQKKIEDLEKEKQFQSQQLVPNQQFQEELKEMKSRIQDFENENKNLREEKNNLSSQITNLTSYNQNQEQLIHQFQNSYQQLMQNMTQQQQFMQNNNDNSKTQPIPKRISQDSVCNYTSNNSGNKEIQDFKQFLQKQQNGINFQSQIDDMIHMRNGRGHTNLSYDAKNIHTFSTDINKNNETYSQQPPSNRSNHYDTSLGPQSVKVVDYQQQKSQSSNRHKKSISYQSARENGTQEKFRNQDEHLFSLSSTQNDQFRISPTKICAPRQLDFSKQSVDNRQNDSEEHSHRQFNSKQYIHQNTSNFGNSEIYQQDVIEEVKSEESLSMKKNNTSQGSFPQNLNFNRLSQESIGSGGPAEAYHFCGKQSDFSYSRLNKSPKLNIKRNHENSVNQDTFSIQDQCSQAHKQSTNRRKKSGRSSGGQTLILITTENKSHGSPQVEEILSNYQGSQQSDIRSPTFKENEVFDGIHKFGIDISNQVLLTGQRSSPFIKNKHRQSYDPSIQQINSATNSHYMSERTMNLKKEITSLDDEILLLQNSLKQALLKKQQNNEEN